MNAYADTSFLGSIYCHDSNEPAALGLLVSQPPLPLTVLQSFELRNTVRGKVARAELDAGQAQRILAHFDADLTGGVLVAQPLALADVFDEAERLSRTHNATTGGRGYDVLHVAAARVLGLTDFFTFDVRQGRFAAAAGLRVLP